MARALAALLFLLAAAPAHARFEPPPRPETRLGGLAEFPEEDVCAVLVEERETHQVLGVLFYDCAAGLPENLYAYVGFDPINFWDPWGLKTNKLTKQDLKDVAEQEAVEKQAFKDEQNQRRPSSSGEQGGGQTSSGGSRRGSRGARQVRTAGEVLVCGEMCFMSGIETGRQAWPGRYENINLGNMTVEQAQKSELDQKWVPPEPESHAGKFMRESVSDDGWLKAQQNILMLYGLLPSGGAGAGSRFIKPGGGGGGGGGDSIRLYHGTTSNRAAKIVGNQFYTQQGFRSGSGVFFAEEQATAAVFGREAAHVTGARSTTVIEFELSKDLAAELGLMERQVIGEALGVRFVDVAGGSGFERLLLPSRVDVFNEALKSGAIGVRRLRQP